MNRLRQVSVADALPQGKAERARLIGELVDRVNVEWAGPGAEGCGLVAVRREEGVIILVTIAGVSPLTIERVRQYLLTRKATA